MSSVHIPILVRPIVEALLEPFRNLHAPSGPVYFVDCTFGGGGHTAAFLDAFARLRDAKVIGIDQDPQAVARGKIRFQNEISEGRLELYQCRFGDVSDILRGKRILGLMADLGFSSDQLEDAGRGLSFQSVGPLDMRLDPTHGQSCAELLSAISESELEQILREYGEERYSRRIASAILSQRREGHLPKTTGELVEIVIRALPPHARHGRIHAATRTFQGLRIAVNDELGQLDRLLNEGLDQVEVGGRVALLSFHSLEDRKVKQKFKDKNQMFQPLTKKPIQADRSEIEANPRARSAKLRIAERKHLNEVT